MTFVKSASDENNTSIAYYRFPVAKDTVIAATATGISFEVRSSGNDTLVSVFIANNELDIETGWEAAFQTGSGAWRKVSLSWDDFVLNYKPWSTDVGVSVNQYKPTPEDVAYIAFGRGNHFHDDYPERWQFDIRKLRLEFNQEQDSVPSQFPHQLAKLKKRTGEKQNINVLLLGDSLTATNKENSWGHRFIARLANAYGIEATVHNAAVPGHTTRGGYIVLERSLLGMPEPDLVCMLYGANDAKGIGISSGSEPMTARDMQFYYEDLIDRVRTMTHGNADLLLLTGNPRYTTKGGPDSAFIVEEILDGIIAAASSRDVFLINTFCEYTALSNDDIARYVKDTVHPSEAGIDFLASLAFDAVVEEIHKEAK
jgi:lysophospholipase L1-like esterase